VGPQGPQGPVGPPRPAAGRAGAARQGRDVRRGRYYGSTRAELAARARKLGVTGASRMDKRSLARAIARKQKSGRRRAA